MYHNDTVVVATRGKWAYNSSGSREGRGEMRGKERGDGWRARTEGEGLTPCRLSLMDDGADGERNHCLLTVAVSKRGHP